jgi:hypothetical protein
VKKSGLFLLAAAARWTEMSLAAGHENSGVSLNISAAYYHLELPKNVELLR